MKEEEEDGQEEDGEKQEKREEEQGEREGKEEDILRLKSLKKLLLGFRTIHGVLTC